MCLISNFNIQTNRTLNFQVHLSTGSEARNKMWFTDQVRYLTQELKSESDDLTEKYINDSYWWMTQISMLYLKMDDKHRLLSILQFVTYYSVMVFHFILLIYTSFILFDINFIIFTQSVHLALLTFLVGTVVLDFQRHRKAFICLHRMMASNFYDYHEPELEEVSVLRKEMLEQRKRLTVIPTSAIVATGAVLVLTSVMDKYGTFDFTRIAGVTSDNLPYAFGVYPYYNIDGFGYYISFVLQMMFAIVLASPIGTAGYTYTVITQNIMLQLKILIVSIKNLEKRTLDRSKHIFPNKYFPCTDRKYGFQEFSYCYEECLRKNFEHHQVIIR